MGVGNQRHDRPLYPRERDSVPIVQEAGWAVGPIWTRVENPGLDPLTVQPIVSRYIRLRYPGPMRPPTLYLFLRENSLELCEF
jgi:hypothetical protein